MKGSLPKEPESNGPHCKHEPGGSSIEKSANSASNLLSEFADAGNQNRPSGNKSHVHSRLDTPCFVHNGMAEGDLKTPAFASSCAGRCPVHSEIRLYQAVMAMKTGVSFDYAEKGSSRVEEVEPFVRCRVFGTAPALFRALGRMAVGDQ
jgi:hypothetical protein